MLESGHEFGLEERFSQPTISKQQVHPLTANMVFLDTDS